MTPQGVKQKADQGLPREWYVHSKILTEQSAWRKIFGSKLFDKFVTAKVTCFDVDQFDMSFTPTRLDRRKLGFNETIPYDDDEFYPTRDPAKTRKMIRSDWLDWGINAKHWDLAKDGKGNDGIGAYLRSDGLVEWEDRGRFAKASKTGARRRRAGQGKQSANLRTDQGLPREWYIRSVIMTQEEAWSRLLDADLFDDKMEYMMEDPDFKTTLRDKRKIIKNIQSGWRRAGLYYIDGLYVRSDGLVEWEDDKDWDDDEDWEDDKYWEDV